MRAALLLVVLYAGAMAQTPCADADLRRAEAESRAAAAEARVESSAARTEALERELASQKGEAEQRLGVERKHVAVLVLSTESAQLEIADLKSSLTELEIRIVAKDVQIAMLSQERDIAERKIERANKRFLCKLFHVGCIGER